MKSLSRVTRAVKQALLFGATSSALLAIPAMANETGAEEIERIEVTGSRIKRSDLEGASPVTVITTADMKIEGNLTVADALRGSSFNSFGSFSERSGSSAQSQATINLRGAGSNRTLVLLDGKRFPGSPTLGGQSANLNAIPMAAVERIEILTDGASSTYGSDAIAGVVNIIMKKDFEGLEFNIGTGHRDRDDGQTSKEFSIITGVSNDKGSITFAFDHQSREGISDGDRDYTKASVTDLNGDGIIQAYTPEMNGWSWYGATVYSPDKSEVQASPLCDDLIAEYGEDTFRKMAMDEAYSPGSTACMFAYANVSYNKASIDRNTVFVDANYEVTEDIEWFGRAMFVQNRSFGRYAPPAAAWENMAADNPHNPYGEETEGNFRWVGIGNRDGLVDDYNQDLLTGLRGDIDWNNASWEVYYHRNDADNKSIGQYYLSYGGLAHNIENGIDLGSEEGIANMKASTSQVSKSVFDQFYAGIGFDMFELPGGSVAHYVGAEYQEISYKDIYDGQSEAGLVGGSAGNSSQGERDITAFFYEAALPVSDSVEVNLAVRYDDYSDFGDNTAPKASVRWQVLDNLVFRASYSEAFRAPGLDELNAKDTFSAEEAIDYRTGKSTKVQYDTWYKSNPDLGPETSEYINAGIAWDISDNAGLKVDYFDLQIDNVVQTKSVQALLDDEAKGKITAFTDGADVSNETFYLIRSASGALLEAGTGYFNGTGFNIQGVDVSFNANLETEFGDFGFNMVNSFTLSYEEERGGELVDTAGWSEQPDYKAVATLAYTIDDHSFAWNVNYTASTSENEQFNSDSQRWETDGSLDSWLIHNFTYSYDVGDYGVVMLTVNNLTDEDPVLSSAGSHDYPDLYDNTGRDYRLNYKLSF